MVDFTYMSLGGGVQSGTMAEMIVEGELPKPDLVLFADTGDEPAYVYEYVEYLRGRLAGIGVELITVTAGNIVENLTRPDYRFAVIPAYTLKDGKKGMLKRQCTSEFKVAPIEAELRRRLLALGLAFMKINNVIRVKKYTRVEAWLGISLDEVARMKPSRTPWITNKWPLIERRMTRKDCIQWLKDHALPVPNKSSCNICPFHDNGYWKTMKEQRPDDWSAVIDFDNSLRDERKGRFAATANGQIFLHSNCIPLELVDLRTVEEKGQPRLFEDDTPETVCDSGYCFV